MTVRPTAFATRALSAAEARVLFVHAHPDDESIMTGGTMAQLAAAGAAVTLLTATRGEGGEVIGEQYAALFGDRPGLAAHRETELAAAAAALGVTDHRFLGDGAAGGALGGLPARRFEDSGMEWGPDGHAREPADMPAAALCRTPVSEVAAYIREVVRSVDPHLVITYSDGGGYGHPDHRHVHRATVEALRGSEQAPGEGAAGAASAVPAAHTPPVLLFADVPAEVAARAFDPQRPGFDLTGFAPAESIPTIAAEAPISVVEDVSAFTGAKAMAMAAHATQVTVAGEFFALSNGVGQHIGDVEYYTSAAFPGPVPDPDGPYESVLDTVRVPLAPPTPAATSGADHRDERGPGSGAAGAGMAAGAGTAAGVSETATADAAGDRRKVGVGAALHALIVGVLIGALGTAQHLNATALDLAGQDVIVPWGLALALALVTAGLWHIATLYRSTGLVVLTAAVICAIGFLFGQPALLPGSDLLVTGSLRSITWIFAPMIVAAILAFTLPALRRRRSAPERRSSPDRN